MINVIDHKEMVGLGTIFDGVDDSASKIYEYVYNSLVKRGLNLIPVGIELTIEEFSFYLDIERGNLHRVHVILEILRELEIVDLIGGKVSLLRNSKPRLRPYNNKLITLVYGEFHDEYSNFYRDGAFLETDFHIAFDVNNENWDRYLRSTPLNYHTNKLAIDWISANNITGGFTDLAFGPTFALERLREIADKKESVIGVDLSAEFCTAARQRFGSKDIDIQVLQRDLNSTNCLENINSESMRGVMFVGAGHFIEKIGELNQEVYRILKPGGHYCLGMVITNNQSYASPAYRLHGALLNPPAQPHDVNELETGLCNNGFEIRFTTQFGPYRSIYAERR